MVLIVCMGVVSATDDVNDTLSDGEAENQPITCINDTGMESDSLKISEEINDEDLSDENGEFVDASEAYDLLNRFRCEEGVWQWNSDDATKTEFNTNDTIWLYPMVRDVELEETAKIRAKELYEQFSHYRPDGTICFTAFPENLTSYGENIARAYSTAESVTEAWKETDEPYEEQGHRRNMLNANFNRVGIAGYKVNGFIYWVQDFGCRNEPIETVSSNVFRIEGNNSAKPKFRIELPVYATGDLIVKINGTEMLRKSTFHGKTDITIYGLNEGSYDVELIYEGDNNYKTANKTERIHTTGDDSPIASFSYLNTLIKMEGDGVKLEKDYTFDEEMDLEFKDGIIIPESITIDGQGHTIDAKCLARIFFAVDGATLRNIEFRNATSSNYGGAVLSYNYLSIKNCNFTGNYAEMYGGAVYTASNQINCENSRFTNNHARLNGGALFGEAAVIVRDSTFINNQAGNLAGAVYAQGTLSSDNSKYINNTNLQRCGRLIIGSNNIVDDEYSLVFANATQNYGIVNLNRDLTATQTILINASNVIINGNGHKINAQNRMRIFYITGNNITIRNITLENGFSIGEGGAIYASSKDINIVDSVLTSNRAETGAAISTTGNVFASSSRFIDNTAEAGGAIFSDEGNVTAIDSVFKNNDALAHGGGAIYATAKVNITKSVFTGNDALKYGGVIFTNGKEHGKVFIKDSVFTNNTSKDEGGVFLSSLGADISNSTFTNNSASGKGGVISTYGDVSIKSSNFTNNSAGDSGGALNVIKANAIIEESNFIANTAKSGAAIESTKDVSITKSNFADNKANEDSGAITGERIEVKNSNFTNNNKEHGKTFAGKVLGENSKIIENDKDVSSNYINGSDNQNKPERESDSADSAEKPKKIIPKSTKITSKTKTFKAKAKTKKYSIILKAGKSPVKKVRVFLKIKGKTYKATTNNKGKATFTIKLKKKGTFKATITFKGNKYYKKSSKAIKIKFK